MLKNDKRGLNRRTTGRVVELSMTGSNAVAIAGKWERRADAEGGNGIEKEAVERGGEGLAYG